MSEQKKLILSSRGVLHLPPDEESYAVYRRDWDRIKRMIKSEGPRNDWLGNAGWTCFGIGITCVVTFFTMPDNETLKTILIKAVFLVAGGCIVTLGAVLLWLFRGQKKKDRYDKDAIIAEMDAMEPDKTAEDQAGGAVRSPASSVGKILTSGSPKDDLLRRLRRGPQK